MPRTNLLTTFAVLLLASPVALFAQEAPRAEVGTWGVNTDGMSRTVRAGDDFYRYVNEEWLRTTQIPAGLASIDGFTALYLRNQDRVRDIILGLGEKSYPQGSREQQIADMYHAVTDQARLDKLGLDPIKADLDAIRRAQTHSEIATLMAAPWQQSFFLPAVIIDMDEPLRYMPAVEQTGLTLPGPEYYLSDGANFQTLRVALLDYVTASLRRAGIADADLKAKAIVDLETRMARLQWTQAQKNDDIKMHHPMSPAELARFAPGFDWAAFLVAHDYAAAPKIDVRTDSAVKGMAALFAETAVPVLQDYITFHLIDGWANSLSSDWQEAHFDFHSRQIKGIAQRQSPEKEAVQTVNKAVGEQVGALYVQKWFPASYREQVKEMLNLVKASFSDRIGRLAWMDDATRAEARGKLDKIVDHIGYPERWNDLSGIVIRPDDLVGNHKRLLIWRQADATKSLGEARRDWQWPYVPQEVNAGYISTFNSVIFPAGILQAPYFDPAADPAVNFGAIAAVIGHEFGHAFDDQGSRSDGDGKLRDWWTPASRAEFERRTEGLVKQFNAYEPVPGVKINGRQNLGENIGDLGGLSIAHEAYRRYVADRQGGKAPILDGFTGDQRFFLAWAQIWRSRVLPAEERRRLLVDNHSAGQFRANGIVRNVDAWYDAFGIKPTDKLYMPPQDRVRIW
jgi:endothelin-converting enzyme/putative endopeptidase